MNRDEAWRVATSVAVHQLAINGGNDGRPEHDFHLPESERAQRQEAEQFLVDDTGVGWWRIQSLVNHAAEDYAQSADESMPQPDWEYVRERAMKRDGGVGID